MLKRGALVGHWVCKDKRRQEKTRGYGGFQGREKRNSGGRGNEISPHKYSQVPTCPWPLMEMSSMDVPFKADETPCCDESLKLFSK